MSSQAGGAERMREAAMVLPKPVELLENSSIAAEEPKRVTQEGFMLWTNGWGGPLLLAVRCGGVSAFLGCSSKNQIGTRPFFSGPSPQDRSR